MQHENGGESCVGYIAAVLQGKCTSVLVGKKKMPIARATLFPSL